MGCVGASAPHLRAAGTPTRPFLTTPSTGAWRGGVHAHNLANWARRGPEPWTRHFRRKLNCLASSWSWSYKSGSCASKREGAANSLSEIRLGPVVSGLHPGPAAGAAPARGRLQARRGRSLFRNGSSAHRLFPGGRRPSWRRSPPRLSRGHVSAEQQSRAATAASSAPG